MSEATKSPNDSKREFLKQLEALCMDTFEMADAAVVIQEVADRNESA